MPPTKKLSQIAPGSATGNAVMALVDPTITARVATRVANPQTVDYTLVLTDAGKAIEVNSATAKSVTVPPNATVAFPLGTVLEVAQAGAGAVSLVAGAGVTFEGGTTTPAQGGSLLLRKLGTDNWRVIEWAPRGTYVETPAGIPAVGQVPVVTVNSPLTFGWGDGGSGESTVTIPTGLVGDGVTNDWAAIQASLDAVLAAGGGTVYLPRGTYLIRRTLVIGSKVTLMGAGRGVTVITKPATVKSLLTADAPTAATSITVADGSLFLVGDAITIYSNGVVEWGTTQAVITGIAGNVLSLNRAVAETTSVAQSGTVSTTFPMVANTNAYNKPVLPVPAPDTHITVRAITFDQAKHANDPQGSALIDFTTSTIAWYRLRYSLVEDCELTNAPGDAYSDQSNRDAASADAEAENAIRDCYIHDAVRHGTHLGTNLEGAYVQDNTIVSCAGFALFYCANIRRTIASGNIVRLCGSGFAGIDYRDFDNVISNNVIVDCTTGYAIEAASGTGAGGRLTITDNVIVGKRGITINVPDSVIEGNTIQLVAAGDTAISVSQYADRTNISDNMIVGVGDGTGVTLNAGADDCRVIGNSLKSLNYAFFVGGVARMVAIGNHMSSIIQNVGWYFFNAVSTDCVIKDERNTLTTPVSEAFAPVRLVYEGLGTNGANDPATAGGWFGITGRRYDGQHVRWNSGGGERVSIFNNGVGWTDITTTGGGGGSSLRVEDEGTSVVAAATGINFAGAGVTVTDAGASEALVTIPGATGGAASVPGFYQDNIYDALQIMGMRLGSAGQALGLNNMTFWKLLPLETVQIDGAFFYTHTAGAVGARARLGIYPASAGLPGPSLLVDSGEINVEAVGYKVSTWTAITLQAFTPYFGWMNANDATFAHRPFAGVTNVDNSPGQLSMGNVASSTARHQSLTVVSTFGAAPSTPPAGAAPGLPAPGVLWKIRRV